MSLSWLPDIRDRIEQLAAEFQVPVGLAIGWIEVESGGHIGEVTSLGERGYFQLMDDESASLGLNHDRLSIDIDYSLRGGFMLVDYYRDMVGRWEVETLEGELFWRMVKMAHSIGPGACKVIVKQAVASSALATWSDFRSFCFRNDHKFVVALRHSPAKWCALVDRVFLIGSPFGFDLTCSSNGGKQ